MIFYSSISGHTAVNVGKSMVVVFGGLVDKKFLNDIIVYDIGKYHIDPKKMLFLLVTTVLACSSCND